MNDTEPKCLYRNCLSFQQTSRTDIVTLVEMFSYIEVHVHGALSSERCREIRECVHSGIKSASSVLKYHNVQFEDAFICSGTSCNSDPPHVALVVHSMSPSGRVYRRKCSIQVDQLSDFSKCELMWLGESAVNKQHDAPLISSNVLPDSPLNSNYGICNPSLTSSFDTTPVPPTSKTALPDALPTSIKALQDAPPTSYNALPIVPCISSYNASPTSCDGGFDAQPTSLITLHTSDAILDAIPTSTNAVLDAKPMSSGTIRVRDTPFAASGANWIIDHPSYEACSQPPTEPGYKKRKCITNTKAHQFDREDRTQWMFKSEGSKTKAEHFLTPTIRALMLIYIHKLNFIQSIGNNYTKLGIFLLDDDNSMLVDTFKSQYQLNAEDITQAILKKWIYGTGKKPTTMKTLGGVLREIRLEAQADAIDLVEQNIDRCAPDHHVCT